MKKIISKPIAFCTEDSPAKFIIGKKINQMNMQAEAYRCAHDRILQDSAHIALDPTDHHTVVVVAESIARDAEQMRDAKKKWDAAYEALQEVLEAAGCRELKSEDFAKVEFAKIVKQA